MTNVEYIISLRDKFTEKLKKINTDTKGFDNKISGLSANLAKIGIGVGIAEIGRKMLTLGADFEQTGIAFQTMIGNKAQADDLLKKLGKYADISPYDDAGVVQNAKTIMGFGGTLKDVMPDIKMLGDISMGNADRMQSLTLAFSQVRAAGKLTGQEVLQFVNAGMNPLQIISEKTGISMAVLKKQMEKGAISFDMVKEALYSATQAGGKFYGMTEALSQTTGGRFSTLIGTLQKATIQLFNSLKPYIDGVVDALASMAAWFKNNIDTVKTVIIWVVRLGAAFAAAKIAMVAYAGSMVALEAIQYTLLFGIKAVIFDLYALKSAMIMTGIGAAVIGLGLIVAKLMDMQKQAEKTTKAVIDLQKINGTYKGLQDRTTDILSRFANKKGTSAESKSQLLQDAENEYKGVDAIYAKQLQAVKTGQTALAAIKKKFAANGFEDALTKAKKNDIINNAENDLKLAEGVLTAYKGQKNKLGEVIGGLKVEANGNNFGLGTTAKTALSELDKLKLGVTSGDSITKIESAAPKVFNINIAKMVETFNVNSQTVASSTIEVKNLVLDTLLNALNDVQITANA